MEFLQEKTGERKTKLEAYCDLMAKASAHFVSPFLKGRVEEPGDNQCHVTLSELAVEWKWHRVTVRSFLDKLEELGQIQREKLPKSVIILIPRAATADIKRVGTPEWSFVQSITELMTNWEIGKISDEKASEEIGSYIERYTSVLVALISSEPSDSVWVASLKASPGVSDYSQLAKEFLTKLAMGVVGSAALRRTLLSYAKGDTKALEAFFKDDLGEEWTGYIEASKILAELVVDGQTKSLESQSGITRTEFLSLRSSFKALVAQLKLQQEQL